MVGWIVLGAVAVVLAVGGLVYNRLGAQKNEVDAAWRQIDVQLQRRHDLISNLVETVKGYAAHERSVLSQVTEARAGAGKARAAGDVATVARAESALGQAMVALNAVVEAYPELRADAHFEKLMTDLSDTENRVASSRRIYNAAVEGYHTAIDQMPASIIAQIGGFSRRSYFELAAEAPERAAPEVRF